MTKCLVTDFLSQDDLLARLAEDAAGLSEAALRLRRVMNDESCRKIDYDIAVDLLNGAIADFDVVLEQIQCKDDIVIRGMRNKILARWVISLSEKEKKKDEQKAAGTDG